MVYRYLPLRLPTMLLALSVRGASLAPGGWRPPRFPPVEGGGPGDDSCNTCSTIVIAAGLGAKTGPPDIRRARLPLWPQRRPHARTRLQQTGGSHSCCLGGSAAIFRKSLCRTGPLPLAEPGGIQTPHA